MGTIQWQALIIAGILWSFQGVGEAGLSWWVGSNYQNQATFSSSSSSTNYRMDPGLGSIGLKYHLNGRLPLLKIPMSTVSVGYHAPRSIEGYSGARFSSVELEADSYWTFFQTQNTQYQIGIGTGIDFMSLYGGGWNPDLVTSPGFLGKVAFRHFTDYLIWEWGYEYVSIPLRNTGNGATANFDIYGTFFKGGYRF